MTCPECESPLEDAEGASWPYCPECGYSDTEAA